VNIARGVSHLFNKTILISIGVHFIAVGGFSFTISGYFWGEIEQTLSNLYTSKTGASTYPPIMMFKILILQAWYALSDEALEKQIARVDGCYFIRLVVFGWVMQRSQLV
jgi:IS5 family transposase